MRNRIVIAVALSVLMASSAFAAVVDTPGISTGVAGHAKQTITVTAGASGLPYGFAVRWMDRSTYLSNGGVFPQDVTTEMGAAEFTGTPTLNTFGGQYTTYRLAPNQSIKVEVGDLLLETGVEGTQSELKYGETYYFVAVGLDEYGNAATDLSATVSGSTTESTNCTYTVGWWKTHTDAWPVAGLTLGTVFYTNAELLSILLQPVIGNGLVSLAHQLIAAKLNIENGADPTAAAAAIAAADALIGGLVVPPVGPGYLAPATTSGLTQTLDDYNNGVIGPGHCGTVPAEESTWGGVKSLYR
jgi:hypothetical protein